MRGSDFEIRQWGDSQYGGFDIRHEDRVIHTVTTRSAAEAWRLGFDAGWKRCAEVVRETLKGTREEP